LWKVKKSRGKGCWLAEIIKEPTEGFADWVGTQKVFGVEEIQSSIDTDKFYKEHANEHSKFYTSLKSGQIVHYNNGFEQYVRCIVVFIKNHTELKPIGLIGKWHTLNLPSRNADGQIYLPYYPKKIAEGDTFTPNTSAIVESPMYAGKKENVATMPLIDLTVPPMTKEQKNISYALDYRKQIQEKLNNVQDIKTLLEFYDYIDFRASKGQENAGN
jgi:hypothetical protein